MLHLCLPRIIFSTPFAVLTYFLIWYVPPFEQRNVVWYLVFYCLFQSMQTVSTSGWCSPVLCLLSLLTSNFSLLLQCFHVPYSALTMFISSDQKERDSATAYRTSALLCDQRVLYLVVTSQWSSILVLLSGMMVEVLGTVLGTAIQGQIVGGTSDCPAETDVLQSTNISVNGTSRVSLQETVSDRKKQ